MIRLAIVALTLVGASACRTPYDPFWVEPDALATRVHSLAVFPVAVREDLGRSCPTAQIEREVEAWLREAGFSVIDSGVSRAIRLRMVTEMGGLRPDGGPHEVGAIDPEKRSVLEDYSTRELLADHPVDALVRLYLMPVQAPVRGAYASWDGAQQRIQSLVGQILSTLTIEIGGTVPALSLLVVLEGRDGDPLFANRGGIEVLYHRDGPGGFARIPPAELWKDPERLRRAVAYALSPLTLEP